MELWYTDCWFSLATISRILAYLTAGFFSFFLRAPSSWVLGLLVISPAIFGFALFIAKTGPSSASVSFDIKIDGLSRPILASSCSKFCCGCIIFRSALHQRQMDCFLLMFSFGFFGSRVFIFFLFFLFLWLLCVYFGLSHVAFSLYRPAAVLTVGGFCDNTFPFYGFVKAFPLFFFYWSSVFVFPEEVLR